MVIPVGRTTAVVAESRRGAGLDSPGGAAGVLVYTVDTSLATGAGPIRVQVPAGRTLAAAPLAPGEQLTVGSVTIRVDAATATGHRITVTRA